MLSAPTERHIYVPTSTTISIGLSKSLKYGEIWGVLACMAFPDFAYNFSSFVVSSERIYLGSFKTLNSSQEVTQFLHSFLKLKELKKTAVFVKVLKLDR